MKKVKFILGLTAIMMIIANSGFAQTGESHKYAKLVYMGKKCDLDQNFFIGYQSIYEANIAKLYKKQKERAEWDKINGKIVDFLKNPNVTVMYDENGNISFAGGIQPPYSGDFKDKNLNKQERKDNEKAAKLYGSILNTTIREWYKKYQIN